MAKTPEPATIELPAPAPAPSPEEQMGQLHAALAEQVELRELMERRYNQEHQRGMSLELAGQKAEKLAAQLGRDNEALKAQIAELTKENTDG